jgi:saccharopine dehydrogenase-like NADP-dependent oxidoreductase
MAADVAADESFEVTVADRDPRALEAALRRVPEPRRPAVRPVEADLGDAAALAGLVADHDIVLGALASRLGFAALRTVIEAGRPYCDISFMSEDAWTLDELARQRGVTAVVDCGVAPGLSNMLAGAAATRLDPCERIEICVGGLPVERRWPFQYKAAFSPGDVIEEYTRPARVVEGGRTVVREALSDPRLVDFTGLGTLEAVLTDGLRSLTVTLKVPEMAERTLRWPGHFELMRAFRAAGLFDREPIEVDGASVRPVDVTGALLFPKWSYEPGEPDITVMRVTAEGRAEGTRRRLQWDLLDHSDRAADASSMARTTAFPCTIIARLVAEGAIEEPGVIVPEELGQNPGILAHVLEELARRGVHLRETVEDLDG